MDNNDSTKPQETGGLKLMTVFIAVLALHVLVIGGFTVYHLMGSGSSDADLTFDKNHKLKADGTAMTDTSTPDAATADKSTDATAPAAAASTDTASTTGTTPPSAPAPDATATTQSVPTTPPAPVNAAANPPVTPTPLANAPSTLANSGARAPLVISNEDMAQSSRIAPGLLPPPDAPPSSGVTIGAPVSTPAPAPAPAPLTPAVASVVPAPSYTPAPAPAPAHAMASMASGPIMADNSVASGPVHMPAVAPKPARPTATASTEEHAASAMHEAKREIYTVQITDSYKKIAQAHHVTVAQLKEANHIKDDVLHTGQKLIIPAAKTSLAKADVSHEMGTPSRVVLNDTPSTASLSASPAPSATDHHHRTYTVVKGDSLSKIAKKFSVTTPAIMEANNLNDTKLSIGEKLKIPSKEVRGEETRSAGTTVSTPMQPSQVETQPAPIATPAPVEPPVEAPTPQPTPASSPELANLTF